MKILITGAKGLVGSALVEHCSRSGDHVLACDHAGLDISDSDRVESEIGEQRPDAIINCAAWTDVDGCESNAEKAERINALGPENLARAARKQEGGPKLRDHCAFSSRTLRDYFLT